MTISTPVLKPNIIQKIESDFGSTISAFIWKKVLQHQMWTNRSIPVGSILSFFGSQLLARTGPFDELIPQPDSSFWQWCDGAAIINPNSPLLGQNTPDFKEKFLKGYGTLGILGGQSTINLQHNHSGITQLETDRSNEENVDDGGDHTSGSHHTHPISNNWSTSESIIPPYTEIQYYIRIDGGPGSSTPSLDDTIPTTFGSLINDQITEYAKILSQELATTIHYNSLLLNTIIPIGSVIPIMTNIPGVPAPDLNIFQECDGSEITNENSPLRSIGGENRYVPNLIEHYLRVPSTFGLSGQNGGVNDSTLFAHNHGGVTGYQENDEDGDPSGDEFMAARRHRHGINSDLVNPLNVEPPYFTVRFFMRIQ